MIALRPNSAQGSQTCCMGHSWKLDQRDTILTLSECQIAVEFVCVKACRPIRHHFLAVLVHTNKTSLEHKLQPRCAPKPYLLILASLLTYNGIFWAGSAWSMCKQVRCCCCATLFMLAVVIQCLTSILTVSMSFSVCL